MRKLLTAALGISLLSAAAMPAAAKDAKDPARTVKANKKRTVSDQKRTGDDKAKAKGAAEQKGGK